jgi:hypothetical protein
MNKEEYELFKKQWLERFKGYYKKGRIPRYKLKESIYNNPKLLDSQKDDFWVLIGGKLKGDSK